MAELDLETIALNFCSDDIPDVQLHSTMRNHIAHLLGDWYKENRRRMPWRGDDTSIARSAYGTWISEVMLQQTRVETVIEYWKRWMEAFPDISTLSNATPDDVNRLWAGLGYYRRAQMLLQGAIKIKKDFNGIMPETVTELLTIPGIGPYTAGAIASIAYNKSESLVDGNVIRVFSRLFAIKLEVGGGKMEKLCWKIASQLVPPTTTTTGTSNHNESHNPLPSPGDYNQALMELGAVICKPTSPNCTLCPLNHICHANILVKHAQEYDNNSNKIKKEAENEIIMNKNEKKMKTSLELFIKSNNTIVTTTSTTTNNNNVIDIEEISTKTPVFPYDIAKLPREITEFPYKIMKKQPKELCFHVCVLRKKVILASSSNNSTTTITSTTTTTSSTDNTNVDKLASIDGNNQNNNSKDNNVIWKYLFVRRPEKGLLANQWEFPSLLYEENKDNNSIHTDTASSSTAAASTIVEGEDNKEEEKERNSFASTGSWAGFADYFRTQLGLHWDNNNSNISSSSRSSNNNIKKEDDDRNRCEETVIEISSTSDFEPIIHVFSHQRHTMRIVLKDVVVVGRDEDHILSASDKNYDTSSTSTSTSGNKLLPAAVVNQWMTAEEIVAAGITTGCKKILHAVTKHSSSSSTKHYNKAATTTGTTTPKNAFDVLKRASTAHSRGKQPAKKKLKVEKNPVE